MMMVEVGVVCKSDTVFTPTAEVPKDFWQTRNICERLYESKSEMGNGIAEFALTLYKNGLRIRNGPQEMEFNDLRRLIPSRSLHGKVPQHWPRLLPIPMHRSVHAFFDTFMAILFAISKSVIERLTLAGGLLSPRVVFFFINFQLLLRQLDPMVRFHFVHFVCLSHTSQHFIAYL